jgi:hypothetical protein
MLDENFFMLKDMTGLSEEKLMEIIDRVNLSRPGLVRFYSALGRFPSEHEVRAIKDHGIDAVMKLAEVSRLQNIDPAEVAKTVSALGNKTPFPNNLSQLWWEKNKERLFHFDVYALPLESKKVYDQLLSYEAKMEMKSDIHWICNNQTQEHNFNTLLECLERQYYQLGIKLGLIDGGNG